MDNLVTDEIMRRRLLIDGDGVGDDRKLIGLIKAYVGWATGSAAKEEEERGEGTGGGQSGSEGLRPLLSHLHQIEQNQLRTHTAIKVNHQARDMFTGLKGEVKEEIIETKRQIIESKSLLEEATKHRKYSMEYDALAKLIQSKPDRKGTERRRVELQNQLHTLRNRQGNLELKLEERKKNLSMMSSTIERLKELLGEDDLELQQQQQQQQQETVTVTAPIVDTSQSMEMDIVEGKAAVVPAASVAAAPMTPMDIDIPLEVQLTTTTTATTTKSPLVSPTEQEEDQVMDTPIATPTATDMSNEGIVPETPVVMTSDPHTPPAIRTKSEKYEDLSESSGEEG